MNERKKELIHKLKEILNDRDFVAGVISNAETEENYGKVLDFINRGNTDPSDIVAYSVMLDYKMDENGELIIGEDGFAIRKNEVMRNA